MHKDAWIGTINLPEDKVKILRSMFKCVQCRSNDHTLPNCPLMKKWIVKKNPRENANSGGDQDPLTRNVAGVSSVSTSLQCEGISSSIVHADVSNSLPTIQEDSEELAEDDHVGSVEFDLLDGLGSLGITSTSEIALPYVASTFKCPLGSVRSVSSSKIIHTLNEHSSSEHFNLIVDSGCTRHMLPYRSAFINYKETPNSYVILADKSQVNCHGCGTVQFTLQDKSIILHDVLHVPKLRSPLLSV